MRILHLWTFSTQGSFSISCAGLLFSLAFGGGSCFCSVPGVCQGSEVGLHDDVDNDDGDNMIAVIFSFGLRREVLESLVR